MRFTPYSTRLESIFTSWKGVDDEHKISKRGALMLCFHAVFGYTSMNLCSRIRMLCKTISLSIYDDIRTEREGVGTAPLTYVSTLVLYLSISISCIDWYIFCWGREGGSLCRKD